MLKRVHLMYFRCFNGFNPNGGKCDSRLSESNNNASRTPAVPWELKLQTNKLNSISDSGINHYYLYILFVMLSIAHLLLTNNKFD